jgi:hypothetical protein
LTYALKAAHEARQMRIRERRGGLPRRSSISLGERRRACLAEAPFGQGSEGWYNPGMHECPLCGEYMRLSEREVREVDGTVRQVREWICPECDYFEEAETEG